MSSTIPLFHPMASTLSASSAADTDVDVLALAHSVEDWSLVDGQTMDIEGSVSLVRSRRADITRD